MLLIITLSEDLNQKSVSPVIQKAISRLQGHPEGAGRLPWPPPQLSQCFSSVVLHLQQKHPPGTLLEMQAWAPKPSRIKTLKVGILPSPLGCFLVCAQV